MVKSEFGMTLRDIVGELKLKGVCAMGHINSGRSVEAVLARTVLEEKPNFLVLSPKTALDVRSQITNEWSQVSVIRPPLGSKKHESLFFV